MILYSDFWSFMQGSYVLVGYSLDKDYRIQHLCYASEHIRRRCIEKMEGITLEDYCWRKMISDVPRQTKPLNKLAEGEHIFDWLAPSVRPAAHKSGYQHLLRFLSGLSNLALHIGYKASWICLSVWWTLDPSEMQVGAHVLAIQLLPSISGPRCTKESQAIC